MVPPRDGAVFCGGVDMGGIRAMKRVVRRAFEWPGGEQCGAVG